MNVSHGGSIGMMHDTIIQEVGPHPRTLNVDNKQVMYFVEDDDGPFWTTRNMNVSHGGSVGMMHDTIIQEVGPQHPRTLNVDNKQVMYFVEDDDGPFWMTPAQQLATKYDRQLVGTAKSRAKTKIEQLKDLRQSGYDTTKQQYRKEELVALCGQRNLPITIEEQEVKEGWLGKQKGMLQILWERGWINSSKVVSQRKHASVVGSTPAK
jgi:hypothetical protein